MGEHKKEKEKEKASAVISGCRKIVGGAGEGKALVTGQPINFLAMVDTKTGTITDKKHELYGRSLKGAVLVFPYAIGSSVGAYAIYSLREYGAAPSAIVCSGKADITTASGCAIAKIPLVDLSGQEDSSPALVRQLQQNQESAFVSVDADGGSIKVASVKV